MIDTLNWEPLFELRLDITYERSQRVGAAPAGGRAIVPIEGGSFEGPRLRGRVQPGGADWLQFRSDGAMLIDVRLVLRTDDDAMIAMTYTGIAHAEAATMEKFRRRELLPFEAVYVRTTPRFETADPRYLWLNKILAVGNGMRTAAGPLYHVFAIN